MIKDDKLTSTTKKINALVEICLNIANLCDRKGEENDGIEYISENLRMGYRTLSRYLRDGVSAIVDFQEELSKAIERKSYAESSEALARDFLEEVFGDSEIDCINDADKEKIKNFVTEIYYDSKK